MVNARHFLAGGAKGCGGANFLGGGEGDSVTERGPPANNAMPNRGYRRWRSRTAVHKGQISVVLSSEAWLACQKLHMAIIIGQIRLLPLAASFEEVSSRAKAPDQLQELCAAAVLPAPVVCSRSLSCDTAGSSASTGLFLHASAGLQNIHIPHPHIRLLSLPPSSTYIIAFFHLPHPAAAVFAKTFVIRIWAQSRPQTLIIPPCSSY